MNCQQCGLPLDPQHVAQTGHCPRCGAAVAVQQPIAANAYAQAPGSAPNAPAQPLPYPPAPGQPAYGPPPAFGMPPQGYPGGMPPATPPKNKAGLIAVVSVVVVVVLLAGTLLALGFGGKGPLSALGNKSPQTTTNSQTPAATPTPSIPAGFEVYTSEGHFYSVAVPSDWPSTVDKSDREEVEFTGPGNQVALTDDFAPNEGVTPETYTTTICSIVGDSSTNPQPTQVTIGGQTWTKMECESSDGSSHTVVEAMTYKGKMVSLLFSSDAANFAQDQAQFFSVMERTFTFLS